MKKIRKKTTKTGKIGIRPKLISTFLLLTIIPILIIGVFSIAKAVNTIEDEVAFYSDKVVNLMGKNVDLMVGEIEKEYVSMLRNQTTMDAFARFKDGTNEYLDYQEIIKALEIINSSNNYVTASMLVCEQQVIKAGTFAGLVDFEWGALEKAGIVDKVMKGDKSYWYNGYGDEKDMVVFKKIIHPVSGEALGIGVLKVPRINFQKQLDSLELDGEGVELYLIDEENKLLISDNPENINKPIQEVDPTLFDSPEQYAFDQSNVAISGEENFVVYTGCSNNRWKVVMSNDKEMLFAGIETVQYMIIIISVVIAIIATVIGVIISGGIAKPIQGIVGSMQKAENGDLLIQIPAKGDKEISMLRQSFSNMIANIRALIKQTREVVGIVRKNASEVELMAASTKETSMQVSCAIQEIAAGAVEQAGEVEASIMRMQSLAESITQVVAKVEDVTEVTEKTTQTSQIATKTIKELNEQTLASSKITKNIESDIAILDHNAMQIIEVIHLIEGISEQTNLLSLNAAIEAARAGAYGRGFGVVADEVRKLAIQSKDATMQIRDIVENIQAQAKQTVEGTKRASEVFEEQRKAVNKTNVAFGDITTSMDDIRSEIHEINNLILQMNSNKAETVESMEHIQTIVEEVVARTQQLLASSMEQIAAADNMSHSSSVLTHNVNNLQQSIQKFNV